MGSVQNVDRAFFPLDEELELLPGKLTPHAYESLIRLGTNLPFEKAAQELEFVLQVSVSEPTARRYVEAAGKAQEEYQTAEMERLEKTSPAAPKNPKKMFVSVDGAMVPLVGGTWVEVKTLTIGEIEKPVREAGEWVVHSKNHSYFSRNAESSLFQRLALAETHGRGIENAKTVAAVTDGAEWEQNFIDFHCPQAIRILDFPHAAERVSEIGQVLWGEESEQTQSWLKDQLHELKHHGPAALLDELARLNTQRPSLEVLQTNQAYLEKRIDHMQYPRYQTQHLPIGSGAMESGNKVVVEARMKGAGMHWEIAHVNSMLTLRNLLCSDRWQAGWPQITLTLRQQEHQRRKELHQKHDQPSQPQITSPALATPRLPKPTPASSATSKTHQSSIPAPNHPWRRSPIGKANLLHPIQFPKN